MAQFGRSDDQWRSWMCISKKLWSTLKLFSPQRNPNFSPLEINIYCTGRCSMGIHNDVHYFWYVCTSCQRCFRSELPSILAKSWIEGCIYLWMYIVRQDLPSTFSPKLSTNIIFSFMLFYGFIIGETHSLTSSLSTLIIGWAIGVGPIQVRYEVDKIIFR